MVQGHTGNTPSQQGTAPQSDLMPTVSTRGTARRHKARIFSKKMATSLLYTTVVCNPLLYYCTLYHRFCGPSRNTPITRHRKTGSREGLRGYARAPRTSYSQSWSSYRKITPKVSAWHGINASGLPLSSPQHRCDLWWAETAKESSVKRGVNTPGSGFDTKN